MFPAVVLNPVDLIERENCLVDNWVWDETSKSPEVLLSSDSEAAYFFIDPVNESRGTAGKQTFWLWNHFAGQIIKMINKLSDHCIQIILFTENNIV